MSTNIPFCHQCKHRLTALLCGVCPKVLLTGEYQEHILDDGSVVARYAITCPGLKNGERHNLEVTFTVDDSIVVTDGEVDD